MSPRLLRLATLGTGLAVLAALGFWSARTVDLPLLLEIMHSARPWPVALMAALVMLFTSARALRLHLVLQRKGGLAHTFHASNIGQMVNCLLPLRSGEACMVLLLGPHLPGGRGEALSRVFVDRLLDLFAVLTLFGLAAPLLGQRAGLPNAGGALLLGGACGAAVLLLAWALRALEVPALRSLRRAADALGFDAQTWERRAANAMLGLGALLRPGTMFAGGALSLVAWGLVALGVNVGMEALFPSPGFACAILAVSLMVLGLMIAPLPAGLGTTHGAIVLALGVCGIAPEPALAFAILYHAASTVSSLLLGILGLWRLDLSLGALLRLMRAETRNSGGGAPV